VEETQIHIPVLVEDVVARLSPSEGESYLDLTAGYGGHADRILDVTQNYKDAVLVDRDRNAVEYLRAKYREVTPEIVHDDFYSATLLFVESGKKYDMILADFGVSSPQLDKEDRGFSFARDGRLDMRMDERQELDAWRVVNKWSERELAEIFEMYGEERAGRAKMLAREIVHSRPINTTGELAEVIKRNSGYSKRHPATQIFQAIRIVVNDELGEIRKTLPLMVELLKPGGRLALISFHSLEDRVVKEYLKEASGDGIESKIRILTGKPVIAGKVELVNNPRARSAKLRVAQRIK
jgi:16S rRNA (cytosine1402-N4)-methyltransferase